MGYALAKAIADEGAEVILVSGPTNLTLEHHNVQVIHVTSAQDMYEASINHFPDCNAAVLAAAVADFRPKNVNKEKIKKGDKAGYFLELERTPDILASLGKMKKTGQVLAGFSLETTDGLNNAKEKLKNKNLEFIVLNLATDPSIGFGKDQNQITIIDKDEEVIKYPVKSKKDVAEDIVDFLSSIIRSKTIKS